MALQKCKDCGHDVSSEAEACLHCGRRVRRKTLGFGTLVAVVILGIVIMAAADHIRQALKGAPTTTQTR